MNEVPQLSALLPKTCFFGRFGSPTKIDETENKSGIFKPPKSGGPSEGEPGTIPTKKRIGALSPAFRADCFDGSGVFTCVFWS